jgi:hypothetical protein
VGAEEQDKNSGNGGGNLTARPGERQCVPEENTTMSTAILEKDHRLNKRLQSR